MKEIITEVVQDPNPVTFEEICKRKEFFDITNGLFEPKPWRVKVPFSYLFNATNKSKFRGYIK